jgi:hypothetical protein
MTIQNQSVTDSWQKRAGSFTINFRSARALGFNTLASWIN